jgi:hypothetical protein
VNREIRVRIPVATHRSLTTECADVRRLAGRSPKPASQVQLLTSVPLLSGGRPMAGRWPSKPGMGVRLSSAAPTRLSSSWQDARLPVSRRGFDSRQSLQRFAPSSGLRPLRYERDSGCSSQPGSTTTKTAGRAAMHWPAQPVRPVRLRRCLPDGRGRNTTGVVLVLQTRNRGSIPRVSTNVRVCRGTAAVALRRRLAGVRVSPDPRTDR